MENVLIPVESSTNQNQKKKKKKKSRSWFEWFQLLISLSIPLAIIIYTVIENNNDMSIARENLEQDLKIADQRREQDIKLANESRSQDVMLARDGQEEAILVDYFNWLGESLEKNGIDLIGNSAARRVARLKTLTALGQLQAKRNHFLFRSLLENRLVTIQKDGEPLIDIASADLTEFDLTETAFTRKWMQCVSLPDVTLTNASFRGLQLSGARFVLCRLANSDFSWSYTNPDGCDSNYSSGVDFRSASLTGSNFSHARYAKGGFWGASFIRAQMRNFTCSGCTVSGATFDSADMSYATFGPFKYLNNDAFSQKTSFFIATKMGSTLLYYATFQHAVFNWTEMTRANAIRASFTCCKFEKAVLVNTLLVETTIINSSFPRANLTSSSWKAAKVSSASFTGAVMNNVDFTHAECHHCLFNVTNLTGTDFTNTSLMYSDFTGATVTHDQLALARSIQGVFLPNGTRIGLK